MTIQEALNQNIRILKLPEWSEDCWIELPYHDPDGNIDNKIRLVIEKEGLYLPLAEFMNNQDWVPVITIPEPVITIPEPKFSIEDILENPKNYTMQFGPYKGETLDQIAFTDEGLLYLDKIVDENWLFVETKRVIKLFLKDYQKELEDLINNANWRNKK